MKNIRPAGYREIGIVPIVFNGIPGAGLVLLEKNLAVYDYDLVHRAFLYSCIC